MRLSTGFGSLDLCRRNSEKFQKFHLYVLIVFFERNHKNDNKGRFPDFYEFTLYMILKNFYGMAIS